jgi:hypothetical protein
MKQQTKTTSQELQGQEAQSGQKAEAREFATPEQLLRHDAQQTEVPPSIAKRLEESMNRESASLPAKPPWWKRLFGGSSL